MNKHSIVANLAAVFAAAMLAMALTVGAGYSVPTAAKILIVAGLVVEAGICFVHARHTEYAATENFRGGLCACAALLFGMALALPSMGADSTYA